MFYGIDVGALLMCYLVFVNVTAAAVCAADKRAARRRARRVSERTLFMLAAAGGSAGMYIAMRALRHKTLHKRFMIGIPLIMAVQAALFALMVWYFAGRAG